MKWWGKIRKWKGVLVLRVGLILGKKTIKFQHATVKIRLHKASSPYLTKVSV